MGKQKKSNMIPPITSSSPDAALWKIAQEEYREKTVAIIKAKQSEYKVGSDAYNVLRKLEETI